MNERVFIDSGAFVAFLVAGDRLHEDVAALFSRPPKRWWTSVLVVAETYGWFLHRLDEEAARTFRLFVDELPGLEVLDSSADHRRAVWQKLDALRGSKLTNVDASSLVWLQDLGIRAVWGTDHHLAIEGATVTPGPPVH